MHSINHTYSRRTMVVRLCLIATILLAFVLRLDLLYHSDFVVDADEAIVGLMAQHVTKGEPLPTFYYGQHYMGSLEPALTSLVFLFFGSSPLTLKVIPCLFALILVPLTYLLGREIGGRAVGVLAALFVALPPAAFVEWSTKARGGFIEIVVIGTYALLLAVRWLKDDRRSLGKTASIAALLGLGWWTNNQIIYTMLPIGLFFALRIAGDSIPALKKGKELVLHLLVGTAAWILGGLPFWTYNLNNEFVSFKMFGGSAERWKNFKGFVESALPIILGGKRFWHTEDYFPLSSVLAFLLFGAIALAFLIMRRRELRGLFLFRVKQSAGPELLLAFLVATSSVFVLSSFGSLFTAPRYLLPIYPPLYVLVAFVLVSLGRVRREIFIALTSAVLFFNLASYYLGGRSIPGEPIVFEGERVQRDHRPLIQWLDERGYSWIRTNYWIGYRLAFETEERIRFLIFQPPHQVRLPKYQQEGERLPLSSTPFVLTTAQTPSVERGLTALGYSFERVDLGGYQILHRIRDEQITLTPIPKDGLRVTASHGGSMTANIVDGDRATRWGSGAPQAQGMKVTVEFKDGADAEVRGLRYELGEFKTDFPRLLSISCVAANGDRSVILTPESYLDTLFVLEGKPLELRFPKRNCHAIELIQEGSDSFFDWSIAELSLLR